MKTQRALLSRVLLAAACFLAVGPMGTALAQRVIELRGFRYAEYYDAPKETRVKTRLHGEKAQPLGAGIVAVTGVRLETFLENGEPELVMEAPQCIHDSSARTVSSAGPLMVRMADGSFSIQGEGFHFQQTNSVLAISNRVQTAAQPDLLQGREGEPEEPGTDVTPLVITSDQFQYSADEGLGLYRGNVRVLGTNVAVRCGLLTLKLPVEERRLRNIAAEGDVIMDYEEMHATGQKAIYDLDSGIAVVTGQPTWSTEGREGRAERFTIDRTNRFVLAEGNAWLRMPGQTLAANLLPRIDSLDQTNSSAPQSVEVRSATYELRTNMAVFHREVVVTEMEGEETAGQLTCAVLTALFGGTNQLDQLIAQGGVEIARGDNRLRSREAIYYSTNQLLDLRDNPSWQAGSREGKGRHITVDTAKNEMNVRGNASMRMPAEAFSAVMLQPGLQEVTISEPGPNVSTPGAPDMEGQVAEIFSAEYDLRPDRAVFRGGVYVSHPQTAMSCQVLTVDLPAEGGHVERILADQQVNFDLVDRSGQRVKGASDNAVYSYSISGNRTNELLELAGGAFVQNTNGILRSPVIFYDRVENKVSAPAWKMRGTVPGGHTNLLAMPR
jgi:lipopolysaccharide export system protein LptA